MADNPDFFRTIHEDSESLEAESFLLEVDSQFKSEEVHKEVRWRLEVLNELAGTEGMDAASSGLRKELSKIFATIGDENEILEKLKELTEVEGADGGAVDLRRFIKREKRTLNQDEYRKVLLKKTENTTAQIKNLTVFFPEAFGDLTQLAESMESLVSGLQDPGSSIKALKDQEDEMRQTQAFARYEELKMEFLRQWLGRFGNLSDEEIEKLSPEEIQRIIMEHQRHQMTALLKSQVKQVTLDMTEYLEPHDTLEASCKDPVFWDGANSTVKRGFKDWITGAIQAYGMLKGQRYALFQNEKEAEQLMLFGIGVGSLSGGDGKMLEMVPFIKPFTRKGGYLLEIRQRDMGDQAEYHAELRHYVLPFIFAFDSMREFDINGELLSFFTSNY